MIPKTVNLRALEGDFSFSQARRDGDTVYLSGIVSWDGEGNPRDVGDFNAQVRNVYAEIGDTLGCFGLAAGDVIKETIFTTDLDRMVAAAPIRAAFFAGTTPPASTWVQVSRLLSPDFLLEVEITARIPKGDEE